MRDGNRRRCASEKRDRPEALYIAVGYEWQAAGMCLVRPGSKLIAAPKELEPIP
jgi:hypothetical protein